MMLVDKRNEIPTMQGIIAGGTAEYGVARISAPCFAKGRTKKKLEKIFKKKMNSSLTRSLHYYLTGMKPAASLCQVWIKARSKSIAKEVWLRFAGAARSSPGQVGFREYNFFK